MSPGANIVPEGTVNDVPLELIEPPEGKVKPIVDTLGVEATSICAGTDGKVSVKGCVKVTGVLSLL